MSRIRVYELAKEAGMSSKALADKLLELGFDIKGHSSSVDDGTAESIRNALKKSAHSEQVQKRAAGEGDRQAAMQRKSTVIRRRPAAVVDETIVVNAAPEQTPDAPESKVVEALHSSSAMAADQPQAVSASSEISANSGEPSEAPETVAVKEESTEVRRTVESKRQDDYQRARIISKSEPPKVLHETPAPKGIPEKIEEQVEATSEVTPVPPREATTGHITSFARPEPKIKREQKPFPKKSMARVVRTIELPAAVEEAPSARPKKKVVKPLQPRRPGATSPEDAAAAAAEEAARIKKKGKKVVEPEADKDSEFRRGAKKGQKNVKFTHFAQDYLDREGNVRRGKRGRKPPKVIAAPAEMKASKKRFKVFEMISVGDLAQRMKI